MVWISWLGEAACSSVSGANTSQLSAARREMAACSREAAKRLTGRKQIARAKTPSRPQPRTQRDGRTQGNQFRESRTEEGRKGA
jgi:hypothetical protein